MSSLISLRNNIRAKVTKQIPSGYRYVYHQKGIININKHFYLYGPVGVGKTFILWGIKYHALVRQEYLINNPVQMPGEDFLSYWPMGCGVKVVNPSEIVVSHNSARLEEKESVLYLYQSTRILLLDDMGAEKQSDHTDDLMFQIIDYRITHDKLTGFTSNMPIHELPYDDRMKSRILGMTMGNVHLIDGKDRRLNKGIK